MDTLLPFTAHDQVPPVCPTSRRSVNWRSAKIAGEYSHSEILTGPSPVGTRVLILDEDSSDTSVGVISAAFPELFLEALTSRRLYRRLVLHTHRLRKYI